MEPTPPPSPVPVSRGTVFFRRLLSSVVLWALVISSLFAPNKVFSDYTFLIVMVALSWLGQSEFYTMAEKQGLVCFKEWGIFGGVLLMVATFLHLSGELGAEPIPSRVNDFETSFLIIFVLGVCLRKFVSKRNKAGIPVIAITLFGILYVPWLLNFIQKIHFFPDIHGNYYVLYFVLVTKFSDLGAYVTGSLFGKHKMIPRVSPGKTWEGFYGAIVISTGASVLFAHFAGARLVGMTWIHAVILGVALSVAAVIGDLVESIFKREAGVKDSGNFFPGIGGILDLMDSLLFNAPLMYLYLRHVLTN